MAKKSTQGEKPKKDRVNAGRPSKERKKISFRKTNSSGAISLKDPIIGPI